MQHLLRKQIILWVSFVLLSVSTFAQIDETFQQDHDQLPYYLGMSLGLSNSYLSLKRGSEFLAPAPGAVNLIAPIQTMYLNLGLRMPQDS